MLRVADAPPTLSSPCAGYAGSFSKSNTSEKGRLLARTLRDSFEDSFPQFTSRGIKGRKKGSRGAYFLRATSMPACITEPFFGTNKEDWELATKNKKGMASAIAGGISLYTELAERW